MPQQFDFGEALKRLKAGKRVQRNGWNGKGMWLVLVNMGGPPEPGVGGTVDLREHGLWAVSPYVAMKTAQETFVPWLASQTDMLSDDWVEVS